MPYVSVKRGFSPVGRVYYEDIGSSDKPVIVMQHGDGNDSQDWKSLGYVDKLAPHFRLILIDYLGYGQSDKVYDPAVYSMPFLASDTISILTHLGITKDVIFFGGSMGARVGYELATTPEYAAFFSGFILNGMGTSENKIINTFGAWAKEGGMDLVVSEMNKYMAERFPAALEATFLRNDPKAYAAANENSWPAVTDKLGCIDKPVQFICGERTDERAEMEAASKAIPGAEIHVLPGLDHAQAYWYSDAVVPLILPFIDKALGRGATVSAGCSC